MGGDLNLPSVHPQSCTLELVKPCTCKYKVPQLTMYLRAKHKPAEIRHTTVTSEALILESLQRNLLEWTFLRAQCHPNLWKWKKFGTTRPLQKLTKALGWILMTGAGRPVRWSKQMEQNTKTCPRALWTSNQAQTLPYNRAETKIKWDNLGNLVA